MDLYLPSLSIISFSIICISGRSEPFKSCALKDGRVVGPGEKFTIGCSARCTCDSNGKGSFGCVSFCGGPPQPLTPACHYARKVGDCCPHPQCPPEVNLKKCSAGNLTTNATIPWHMEVRDGKTHFEGVLVSYKGHIFSPDDRITEKSLVENPEGQWNEIKVLKKDTKNNLATIQLVNITITPELHEINVAPGVDFCNQYLSSKCPLLITAHDPKDDSTYHVVGQLDDNSKCGIKLGNSSQRCMQIKQYATKAGCHPLSAGADVSIQIDGYYYLVGLLANDYKCPASPGQFYTFNDVCNIGAKYKFD